MTLKTPNTLPNFKCKNVTIKSGALEKLLGVIIDNKLDFMEHLNTVCKKANLKLHALNRIFRFLSQEQYVLIISAYIKSCFNYCLLVWLFCCRALCIKWIKFKSGPYVYYWKPTRWFSRFLEVHWWYINLSKMYKLIIKRSIQIYSWSFSTRANIYNTRQFNVFEA